MPPPVTTSTATWVLRLPEVSPVPAVLPTIEVESFNPSKPRSPLLSPPPFQVSAYFFNAVEFGIDFSEGFALTVYDGMKSTGANLDQFALGMGESIALFKATTLVQEWLRKGLISRLCGGEKISHLDYRRAQKQYDDYANFIKTRATPLTHQLVSQLEKIVLDFIGMHGKKAWLKAAGKIVVLGGIMGKDVFRPIAESLHEDVYPHLPASLTDHPYETLTLDVLIMSLPFIMGALKNAPFEDFLRLNGQFFCPSFRLPQMEEAPEPVKAQPTDNAAKIMVTLAMLGMVGTSLNTPAKPDVPNAQGEIWDLAIAPFVIIGGVFLLMVAWEVIIPAVIAGAPEATAVTPLLAGALAL